MENASKALLIAGGVLITMIVASFGVYLYGVYHDHSEKMLARMSEKEVSEFNAKFQVFEGKELTANEVVSLLNLVLNNNVSKTGNEYEITITAHGKLRTYPEIWMYLNDKSLNSDKYKDFNEKCNGFIKENSDSHFKCKDFKYNTNSTGLINSFTICDY